MHTRAWRGNEVVASDFPIAEVSDHLEHDDEIVWVDLCAPDAETLHELASELDLHELAVEDALSEHQRPKLDRYPTHSFVTCHAIRWTGPERPGRDGDRLLHRPPLAHHRPQERGLPDPGRCSIGGSSRRT